MVTWRAWRGGFIGSLDLVRLCFKCARISSPSTVAILTGPVVCNAHRANWCRSYLGSHQNQLKPRSGNPRETAERYSSSHASRGPVGRGLQGALSNTVDRSGKGAERDAVEAVRTGAACTHHHHHHHHCCRYSSTYCVKALLVSLNRYLKLMDALINPPVLSPSSSSSPARSR